MCQMYKIYINNNPIFLVDEKLKTQFDSNQSSVLKYHKKFIPMIVDQMEKTDEYTCKVLYSDDPKSMKKEFFAYFKRIDAAGGVVVNAKNNILMIRRNGYWDLPKGKIEKKEKKKRAAIREVNEETGVKNLMINSKLGSTYHCYKLKDKTRILKKTIWYLMYSEDMNLYPQYDEGISQAIWADSSCIFSLYYPYYGNIRDILVQALDLTGLSKLA